MNNKIKDNGGKKDVRKKSKKKSSESKRKLKTQSLIVPTIVSEDNYGNGDNDDRRKHLERCPSPGGGSCFSQRLRSFRRFRSLSKSRDDGGSSSGAAGSSNNSSCDDSTMATTSAGDRLSLYPDASMTKSSSLIDLKSLCSKLHRHFKSTGLCCGCGEAKSFKHIYTHKMKKSCP